MPFLTEKLERLQRLQRQLEAQARAISEAMVGTTERVLVEGPSGKAAPSCKAAPGITAW